MFLTWRIMLNTTPLRFGECRSDCHRAFFYADTLKCTGQGPSVDHLPESGGKKGWEIGEREASDEAVRPVFTSNVWGSTIK